MLLQGEGIAAKARSELYCCDTAIYSISEILAYLRTELTLVISIARKGQLKHEKFFSITRMEKLSVSKYFCNFADKLAKGR